jgi:hypothetical protein
MLLAMLVELDQARPDQTSTLARQLTNNTDLIRVYVVMFWSVLYEVYLSHVRASPTMP